MKCPLLIRADLARVPAIACLLFAKDTVGSLKSTNKCWRTGHCTFIHDDKTLTKIWLFQICYHGGSNAGFTIMAVPHVLPHTAETQRACARSMLGGVRGLAIKVQTTVPQKYTQLGGLANDKLVSSLLAALRHTASNSIIYMRPREEE